MTDALVVDYSFARPDPATTLAAGYSGIIRYLAPLPNAKVATREELAAAHDAGLAVALVWETYEQAAMKTGYAGGQDEGARAFAMAEDVGYPHGCAVYFVLEDPRPIPASGWDAALDYARGVKDLGAPYRVGGYGSQALVEEAIARGVVELGWQVEGWSHSVSPACHLYQRSNGREHDLPGTDENAVLQADYGAWLPGGQPQPQPEDDMKLDQDDFDKIDGIVRNRIKEDGVIGAADPNANGNAAVMAKLAELEAKVDALEAGGGGGGGATLNVSLTGTATPA